MVEIVSHEPANLKPLTSLRFFAALAIVWLHAKLYFPWSVVGPDLPFRQGVCFFFVLSGFILIHVYGNRSRLSYSRFLIARIARIWPVHIVTLICVFLLIRSDSQAFGGAGFMAKEYSLLANIFLLQSWVPTTSYMFSWNAVSWSISTELFFYVAFPCLLFAIRANPVWGLVIGMAPLVTIAVINHFIQLPVETGVFGVSVTTLLYAFPVSRLFEFVLGMMSYVGWQRWLQSQGAGSDWKIELAMVGLWVGWFGWVFGPIQSTLAPYPVAYQWFGQAGSCFLFALTIAVFASGSGSLVKILSQRRLVQLGEISFALYMVHQIIMKWFVVQIPDLASPLLVLGSCLIAGTIVHYGIEVPLRHTVVRRYERFRLAAAPSV